MVWGEIKSNLRVKSVEFQLFFSTSFLPDDHRRNCACSRGKKWYSWRFLNGLKFFYPGNSEYLFVLVLKWEHLKMWIDILPVRETSLHQIRKGKNASTDLYRYFSNLHVIFCIWSVVRVVWYNDIKMYNSRPGKHWLSVLTTDTDTERKSWSVKSACDSCSRLLTFGRSNCNINYYTYV